MTPLSVALSMILTLTLLASGCCSPTARTVPHLPPGKPSQATAQKIAEELQRDGLTPSVFRRVLMHMDEWRAWALALEAAGRWKK